MKAVVKSWGQALAAYRSPVVLAMLFLGFSAGLPFLLVFSTLSAWLTQVDVSRTTIGMFSWVGLTYSVKVFWAPFVDRLRLPILFRLLGRRRSWMLLAQCGIATGLLGLAGADPGANLQAVALLSLLVAFSSATQDIVVDAWRIEAAPKEEQGAMAAAYQLGYRIALLVAGAGALFLAAEYSWSFSYTVMACCVGVGAVTTLLIKDRSVPSDTQDEGAAHVVLDSRLPRPVANAFAWFYGAVVGPFREFFSRNGLKMGLTLLAFIGLFRLTDITMGVMANPFYLDVGFTLKQIAIYAKGYGVFMSILGVVLGGAAVARWGASRTLVISGVLVILTNLSFATLAWADTPSELGLALVISGDNFSYGLSGTAFIAYLSGLTSVSYTATQYALFSSLFVLPGKLLAGVSGVVVEGFGYPLFFVYTSILGVPALMIMLYLIRHEKRES